MPRQNGTKLLGEGLFTNRFSVDYVEDGYCLNCIHSWWSTHNMRDGIRCSNLSLSVNKNDMLYERVTLQRLAKCKLLNGRKI
jgi:hypothetical protein